MMNDQQQASTGGLARHMLKKKMQYAKCNFRFPLKLELLNIRCTSTSISMTYFKNRVNSHISHIETKLMYRKNNAEENITYKIILSKR